MGVEGFCHETTIKFYGYQKHYLELLSMLEVSRDLFLVRCSSDFCHGESPISTILFGVVAGGSRCLCASMQAPWESIVFFTAKK
jgi:hypothetical protein